MEKNFGVLPGDEAFGAEVIVAPTLKPFGYGNVATGSSVPCTPVYGDNENHIKEHLEIWPDSRRYVNLQKVDLIERKLARYKALVTSLQFQMEEAGLDLMLETVRHRVEEIEKLQERPYAEITRK